MHDAERIDQIHRLLREAHQPVSMAKFVNELQVGDRTFRRELTIMGDFSCSPAGVSMQS